MKKEHIILITAGIFFILAGVISFCKPKTVTLEVEQLSYLNCQILPCFISCVKKSNVGNDCLKICNIDVEK